MSEELGNKCRIHEGHSIDKHKKSSKCGQHNCTQSTRVKPKDERAKKIKEVEVICGTDKHTQKRCLVFQKHLLMRTTQPNEIDMKNGKRKQFSDI